MHIDIQHMLNRIVERRNDGRNDPAADLLDRNMIDVQHFNELRTVFVRRTLEIGRDAEGNSALPSVIDRVFDIGIADVNANDHRVPPFRSPLKAAPHPTLAPPFSCVP